MNMIEAIRLALAEVGDVTAEELVAFVKDRYGVTVGAPNGWSMPLSRSFNAWTTCSFVRPGGIDCGMTAPSRTLPSSAVPHWCFGILAETRGKAGPRTSRHHGRPTTTPPTLGKSGVQFLLRHWLLRPRFLVAEARKEQPITRLQHRR